MTISNRVLRERLQSLLQRLSVLPSQKIGSTHTAANAVVAMSRQPSDFNLVKAGLENILGYNFRNDLLLLEALCSGPTATIGQYRVPNVNTNLAGLGGTAVATAAARLGWRATLTSGT